VSSHQPFRRVRLFINGCSDVQRICFLLRGYKYRPTQWRIIIVQLQGNARDKNQLVSVHVLLNVKRVLRGVKCRGDFNPALICPRLMEAERRYVGSEFGVPDSWSCDVETPSTELSLVGP